MLSSRISFLPAHVALVFLGVLAAGCQQGAEIETYTTDPADRTTAVGTPLADGPDATLAAIVPRERELWFFKLTGPTDAVSDQRETFSKVIESIKFDDRLPKWTTPEGWDEEKGGRMRLATLRPPEDAGKMELSISPLPRPGFPLGDLVSSNVNRWRRQLQLPVQRQVEISDAMQRVSTQDGAAMVFFLTGKRSDDGRRMQVSPGSSNLPAGHPQVAASQFGSATDVQERPEKKPAVEKTSVEKAPAKKPTMPLTFQSPENWREGPRSAMRRASFLISDENLRAEVRVSDFPTKAGPQITSLSANLNRWRREVGLERVQDEEMAEAAYEPLEISGKTGHYVALDGPDSPSPALATRVAMVIRGKRIWFFKLSGERPLVEKETDRFRQFLASVRFDDKDE